MSDVGTGTLKFRLNLSGPPVWLLSPPALQSPQSTPIPPKTPPLKMSKRTFIRREAQEVPVPTWVSKELLALHQSPELRHRPVAKMPSLTDSTGWKKLIKVIEKQNAEDPMNKKAMEAMMKVHDVDGPFLVGGDKVPCYLTVPKGGVPRENEDKLLIQIHGGAYGELFGSGVERA